MVFGLRFEATEVIDPKRVKRVANIFKDFRPVFRQAIVPAGEGLTSVFESQGGAAGERWAPNDLRWKARKRGKRVLEHTGRLRQVLNNPASLRTKISRKSFAIMFGSRYAKYYPAIAGSEKRGIPPRPLFIWPDYAAEEVVDLIVEYVDAKLAEEGFGG